MNQYFFPYQYALEKLSTAVMILVTGEGDARSRVMLAYRAFGHLTSDQFPPAVQDEYKEITKELTKRLPKTDGDRREWAIDGAVQANIGRMKNRTASKVAERIYNLELQLKSAYEQWQTELRKSSNNT